MKRLHRWVERKTGLIFGFVKTQPRGDFRIVFRIGGGDGADLCDFEAGIAGRMVYLDRNRWK